MKMKIINCDTLGELLATSANVIIPNKIKQVKKEWRRYENLDMIKTWQ